MTFESLLTALVEFATRHNHTKDCTQRPCVCGVDLHNAKVEGIKAKLLEMRNGAVPISVPEKNGLAKALKAIKELPSPASTVPKKDPSLPPRNAEDALAGAMNAFPERTPLVDPDNETKVEAKEPAPDPKSEVPTFVAWHANGKATVNNAASYKIEKYSKNTHRETETALALDGIDASSLPSTGTFKPVDKPTQAA